MCGGATGRALLVVLLGVLSAAGSTRAEEERSRMAPVYYAFSHRVGVRWEGDAVILTLPADRASGPRELRVPGWPVPGPEPRSAPRGLVGVGFDGTPLFNGAPQALPQPVVGEEAGPAPGLEPPRGRAPALGRRPDLSALVGVLLDGFPLYGPVERDGSTAADLDPCGGHVGLTPDHERPIYHYHVSPARPTVCGCLRGIPLPGGSDPTRPSPRPGTGR